MIVYTAITGGKDNLIEDQYVDKDTKFVAFLDEDIKSSVWEIREAHSTFTDPNRNAKIHKILPHKYFPDEEYTIWMDGTTRITSSILPLLKLLDNTDIVAFKHPIRESAYNEATTVNLYKLDNPIVVNRQISRYASEGYPEGYGLTACGVLIRRNTPKIRELSEMWWDEISKGSRRDQLSFDYCRWKLDIPINYMEGSVENRPEVDHRLIGNPYFLWSKHNYVRIWEEEVN